MRLVLSVCVYLAVATAQPQRTVQDANCSSLVALGGAWYDDATQDAMQVSVSAGCVITSKYGTAAILGEQVHTQSGILHTLGLGGRFLPALRTIEWSNSMRWWQLAAPPPAPSVSFNETRLLVVEKAVQVLEAAAVANATKQPQPQPTVNETRLVVLETHVRELLARNAALVANQTVLSQQIRSVAVCSVCPLQGGFAPTAAPPTPSPPTRSPRTPAPQTPSPPTLIPGVPATNAPLTKSPLTPAPPTNAPPTPAPLTPAPPTSAPGTSAPGTAPKDNTTAVLQQLQAQVAELNTTLRAVNATAGKDGYCTILPNVSHVYIPVTRYTMRRGLAGSVCTVMGSGTSPLNTKLDGGCVWSDNMAEKMYAHTGDTLSFNRAGLHFADVRELKSRAAFDECDMTGSTLVAGEADLTAAEIGGKHFSITLTKPGTRWFASGTGSVLTGVDSKIRCWKGMVKPYPGKDKLWGDGVKIEVVVLDPEKAVMAKCPLWDPLKFNVSGGAAVDSKSVERMKGTVGAIGRQLISLEARIAQRVRAEGHSGITVTRSFHQGTDSYHEASYADGAPGSMHNHANFKYTLGMGECGAVLNGVQFQTRHNDFSLDEPDHTQTLTQFISEWPPASRPIDLPGVPPSVTGKGTVAEQVAEMKAYFKAFNTQDKTLRADYDKYFKPNLCYLEGTWQEAQEGIAEPFASDRHHIAADDWKDLMQKVNFLANNGQKSFVENLPFLPTSFRGMQDGGKGGDVFEPRLGQWFYRISCRPINKPVPLSRFRVKNDLQLQFRDVPLTREQLAKTNRALYELHPTPEAKYNPKEPWPKSATSFEYIDELMQDIPGFDGPKGNLVDKSMGLTCMNGNGSKGTLNTAYYSRYYAHATADAMGRDHKKRGFNDYMFAAQTTHPKVSALEACNEFAPRQLVHADAQDNAASKTCQSLHDQASCIKKVWTKAQVSADSSGARCVWLPEGRCAYKKCWKQRWSYAIPLEIVYTTPLSNWNPYNIPFHDNNTPGAAQVRAGGRDGATAATALKGSTRQDYYRTPAEFFQDQKNVDPADTSGGSTFVENAAGEVHKTRASGHWIVFPDIPGVGSVRQRYPIMPIHEQGSSVWKEAKALEELVMGRHSKEVAAIIAETRTQEYGLLLTLHAGSGHTHTVSVPPEAVVALTAGKYPFARVLSTTDSGHTHLTAISYDAKRGAGKEYALDWCTTGSVADTDECLATAGCGKSVEGKDCCVKRCPDGHAGVSPS